jgi:hypothetical protein
MSITPFSTFQIEVTGERVRMLLADRMRRISDSIERERVTIKGLLAVEEQKQKMREAQISMMRGMAPPQPIPGIGGVSVAQMGGDYFGGAVEPVYPYWERPSDRHEAKVRQYEASLAELKWLHDSLQPDKTYLLNRGDIGYLAGGHALPFLPQLTDMVGA